MKKIRLPLLIWFTALLFPGILNAQDIAGSHDHPLITRYPGSSIAYYEEQDYRPYSIALGPQTGYKEIKDWKETEGKFTRIYYVVSGQTTLTEVYRNYKDALAKGGFKVLAQGINAESGVAKEVGGLGFLGTFYAKNPFPTGRGINITSGSATSAGACYIAAQLEQSNANVYVVLGGHQYASDQKVFLLDIIEETKMKDDLITVDAAGMLKAINANGKIALYGIYFDFDKSTIKPESDPTLKEIANLLKENPSLNLYIVGHTDMKGTYDYNLRLSRERADAVANGLIENYGIASARLTAAGVGPVVPVASNDHEDGRKQNRRVELVKK